MNLRAIAAQTVEAVLERGESLATALPYAQSLLENPKDKALIQEITYGVMRELTQLEYFIDSLMDNPLKGKQRIVHHLLLVGAYQLLHMRIPPHAALGETVAAIDDLDRPKFKSLVNGVLRSLQRDHQKLLDNMPTKGPITFNHPKWIIKRATQAFPKQWQQILTANNQRSPMWLRNNATMQTCDEYITQLEAAGIPASKGEIGDNSIILDSPMPVTALPNFDEGACSVQDGAAQQAAEILGAQPGELILDACAAPGGKTCHIIELAKDVKVVALDCDQRRLDRVQQNLDRIGLEATLICGDGTKPEEWWDNEQFDRILLDAPCSATGVIRRNPDIKWLRRESDIQPLVLLQQEIIDACWSLLKSGGTLVYATCSILPAENAQQMINFLQRHDDATLVPLNGEDTPATPGWQLLPGQHNVDGFYYAKLQKQ
jgi:16S rRNA (cytosine967-C5)-methyltransferase